jgi:hypothetical protein
MLGSDASHVWALRQTYWHNGFRPVPIYSRQKRPRGVDWRTDAFRDPPLWADHEPEDEALSTGIATGETLGIDVDVLVQALVDQIVHRVERVYGITPLVRIGFAPKTLLVFRCVGPKFAKLTTGDFTLSADGSKAHVEILADGQQFVADGVHPDTGLDYQWNGGTPSDVQLAELPGITQAQAIEIVAMCRALLAEHGTLVREQNQAGDDASGKKSAGSSPGGEFFSSVNSHSLDSLDKWVRLIFPRAKYQPATGAWRVASRDRGRPDLQEDISFHPDGIRDFGEEHPLSAIDAVIAWGGERDAEHAAFWLCDKLGRTPESFGWERRERERKGTNGAGTEEPVREIFGVADTFPDERDIPVRPWIARNYLMRGAITMPFGPPDQGKSLLLIAWGVALALGRAWGRFDPVEPRRVLMILAEEDEDEQNRRFAAAFRAFGVNRAQVEPNLRRLIVRGDATMFTMNEEKGRVEAGPAWEQVVTECAAWRPDSVILDPLIEFHAIAENDNARLKVVVTYFRWLAREYRLSAVISHHTRKGDAVPGELDLLRGAGSIGAAARFAFTLIGMSDLEARTFNIAHRAPFVRLDRARGSYAPPATDAEWFEKHGYDLDNGDAAPALLVWNSPQSRVPDQIVLSKIYDDIAQGCPAANGEPWSPQCDDRSARSVRRLFADHGIEKVSERETLKALEPLGITESKYRDRHRNVRNGLRTADNLPASSWEDEPQT